MLDEWRVHHLRDLAAHSIRRIERVLVRQVKHQSANDPGLVCEIREQTGVGAVGLEALQERHRLGHVALGACRRGCRGAIAIPRTLSHTASLVLHRCPSLPRARASRSRLFLSLER